MRLNICLVLMASAIVFTGCGKSTPTAPAGPNATVTLKDGSTFAGTVTKSDTSEITIQAANGESRTYPMTQVSGVQYANSAAPATAVAAPQPAAQAPMSAPVAGATPPPAPPPMSPAPQPVPPFHPADEFRTIPAHTTIAVRNSQTIDSETAVPGQTYPAVVARDALDTQGRVAIPHGSSATLVVRAAEGQGKIEGRSDLVVDVGSVNIEGRTYRLETSAFAEKGTPGVGKNKRTGEFLGGGTALGGIIGAIAGGGKGAAIGALSGAAAGGVTQTATRGKPARIPAESLLNFTLETPIRIREIR